MKYLVTGAAGFIGSHLSAALLARGWRVWGLDDLSKGQAEHLQGLEKYPGFTFVKASLADTDILHRLVNEVDVIYHLAAIVGVKQYVEDPVKVIEVDVCQTAGLLKLAEQAGKKVVFASTSEVYGKSDNIPFREDSDRVYGPSGTDRWCYAIAKSAAEHLCFGYARRGLRVVILRYFNVYGPHADSSDYGGVVPRFMRQALANEPLTVHGDGRQTRCFTYIDDIVKGTIEAGTRPEAEGRVFNLGHRRETSIRELAGLVLKICGSESKLVYQPYAEFYGPYYEDIPRRIPDLAAAEAVLGYQPAVDLEDGLRRTFEWYKTREAHKD